MRSQREYRCPECGTVHREYREHLNKTLVMALAEVGKYDRGVVISQTGLTHTQINNFCKLRHWGLAEQNGDRGFWRVTELGREFLSGRTSVYNIAVVYKGVRSGFAGDLVTAREVIDPRPKSRKQYATEEARPVPLQRAWQDGKLF